MTAPSHIHGISAPFAGTQRPQLVPGRRTSTLDSQVGTGKRLAEECLVIEKGQLVAGRYRLLESVGTGGMGVVWQAKDERLGRTVAIKQLLVRPGLSESKADDPRRRAMREARIAARLQHPNAIALFDVAEHDGDPCLVMEFLPSRSLAAVLAERGSLPPDQVAEIGAQVASALAAAHAAGIVHRDVKPGNILLDGEGTVKITDFGISRALDDGTVTQTGMLAGTPAYLAPEIARGQRPDRASDVFSLGATLYHAVEGTPPFGTNSNPLALLHAVASGQVSPPKQAGALTPVLMSLLRADATDRLTMPQAAASLASPTIPHRAPPAQPEQSEQQTVPVSPARPPTIAQSPPVLRAAESEAHQPPAGPGTQRLPGPSPELARRPASPAPKRVALIAAAVAVAVLAGVITAIVLSPSGNTGAQGTASSASSPPSGSSPSPTQSQAQGPVGAPINWSQAGQLIIDYYNGLDDLPAAWEKLSATMRADFGDQQAFAQHWGQFKQVSARNARGVTPNPDGSVNVPVDVTYTLADGGTRQEHRVLRVINENGRLAIDSEAR